MPTIKFNSKQNGSSYVVLDPQFNTNPVLSTVPKYFSNVSFSNFTKNISEDDIVVNDYKIGIVVPKGTSKFDFTPSTPIPISDVIIRGAGTCEVVYTDGATTITVPPSVLNRREEGSSLFTNPFCFEFNGNSDSVKVAGSTATLELYNEISISVWVTIDADVFNTGSGEKDYYIVDKLKFPGGGVAEGYGLYIRRAQGGGNTVKLRGVFGIENNTIFQGTTQVDIQPGAVNALAPNTPHNIVVTYAPGLGAFGHGRIRTYINGTVVPSATKNISNAGTFRPANSEKFIIGNASVSGTGPGIKEYHGKIDEVSIWDTELTAGDVANLNSWNINGNLNNYSKSANLVGWYRMGENAVFASGNWTLKSATNISDTTLYLTSEGVAQIDRKEPGLVGPA